MLRRPSGLQSRPVRRGPHVERRLPGTTPRRRRSPRPDYFRGGPFSVCGPKGLADGGEGAGYPALAMGGAGEPARLLRPAPLGDVALGEGSTLALLPPPGGAKQGIAAGH